VAFEEYSPDRRIDLGVFDPPDNAGMKYDNYHDRLPVDEYVAKLRTWLKHANDIVDGPIFFSFAPVWMADVEIAIRDLGIRMVQRIFWHFSFGQNSKTKYTSCLRPFYWLKDARIFPQAIKIPSARQTKYNDRRAKEGGKLPENMWDFSRVCGTHGERRKFHPNQFPIALLERIVLGHSVAGMTVLDGFAGSGTTAYACALHERHCVGTDVSGFYLAKIRDELLKRGASEADIAGGV
jgi:site-specific DNA-methyltransferase (adenine-specific)